MQISAKIRSAAIASFVFCASLAAQAPIAKPSAAVSMMPSAQPPQQPLAASQQAPHAAEVTYIGGELFVSAKNSSLNQILREIARKTEMKITGSVTDERVFGQYGPAAPAQILGTLLDGTGSNMLLLQATAAAPAELILTPRQGGPTPPNPNASAFDGDSADGSTQQQFPASGPAAISPATSPQMPASTTPAASGPGQQTPDVLKTPQQIYEQLQRLRQQQEQQRQRLNP